MRYFVILLLLVPIPVLATTNDDYSHSQGDTFQCATSSSIELVCEIENILKFFFPQIVSIGQSQDSHLQKIISNQEMEIQLLQKLVDNNQKTVITHTSCHKQGTGVLCQ